MTQNPGKYSFAGNAELSADGTLEVLGVPVDADCWAEDEEGATVLKVTSTGHVSHLRGVQIVLDEEGVLDVLCEAQDHWPELQALVIGSDV